MLGVAQRPQLVRRGQQEVDRVELELGGEPARWRRRCRRRTSPSCSRMALVISGEEALGVRVAGDQRAGVAQLVPRGARGPRPRRCARTPGRPARRDACWPSTARPCRRSGRARDRCASTPRGPRAGTARRPRRAHGALVHVDASRPARTSRRRSRRRLRSLCMRERAGRVEQPERRPDRLVAGVQSEEAAHCLAEPYAPGTRRTPPASPRAATPLSRRAASRSPPAPGRARRGATRPSRRRS